MSKSDSQQAEVFKFLDDLRSSGPINMLGAAPHIMRRFDLSGKEALRYLRLWIEQFREDGTGDPSEQERTCPPARGGRTSESHDTINRFLETKGVKTSHT